MSFGEFDGHIRSTTEGGFGPGFTGLNGLFILGSPCEDFRRRGPDY